MTMSSTAWMSVICGTLRRHRETTAGLLAGAGWDHEVVEDARWNELDADDIVRVHAPEHDTMTGALAHYAGQGASHEFDAMFGAAMARGLTGDGDHLESFADFTARIRAALANVVARVPEDATALVVTSRGAQTAVTTEILGGDAETWMRVFGMFPNTGIMTLTHGERGLRLRSLGEISHLDRRPDLLSER